MNLILFGLKGCGKTTSGQAIAKKIRENFIDTDHLIEKLYLEETGQKRNFREIFKEIGAEKFRKMEETAVKSLKNVKNSVISVGGGTLRNQKNLKILSDMGILVYLFIDKNTLKNRLFSLPELPAFLDSKNPEESFEKMYEERNREYLQIPNILKLDVSKLSISETVDLILINFPFMK